MTDLSRNTYDAKDLDAILNQRSRVFDRIQKLNESFRKGSATLLAGATGTGKTHSCRTLIDAGLETFIVFTEPSTETVSDIPCKAGLHYHYIPPATPTFEAMIDSATKINTMSFSALSKLSDINKNKYNQFIELLRTLANFKCDRCEQEFGPVDTWPASRALVLDSLSGLNTMAMDLVVGSKPVKAIPDWGVAMDNEERLLTKLCVDTQAWFVLIAHLEREVDEVLGGSQLMASALGKKLSPRIPRNFSDVIRTRMEGDKFYWATVDANTDLKTRNLPLSDKIEPSFVQIVENVLAKAERGIHEVGPEPVPEPVTTPAPETSAPVSPPSSVST